MDGAATFRGVCTIGAHIFARNPDTVSSICSAFLHSVVTPGSSLDPEIRRRLCRATSDVVSRIPDPDTARAALGRLFEPLSEKVRSTVGTPTECAIALSCVAALLRREEMQFAAPIWRGSFRCVWGLVVQAVHGTGADPQVVLAAAGVCRGLFSACWEESGAELPQVTAEVLKWMPQAGQAELGAAVMNAVRVLSLSLGSFEKHTAVLTDFLTVFLTRALQNLVVEAFALEEPTIAFFDLIRTVTIPSCTGHWHGKLESRAVLLAPALIRSGVLASGLTAAKQLVEGPTAVLASLRMTLRFVEQLCTHQQVRAHLLNAGGLDTCIHITLTTLLHKPPDLASMGARLLGAIGDPGRVQAALRAVPVTTLPASASSEAMVHLERRKWGEAAYTVAYGAQARRARLG
eukprot:Hpha_TRINITY_DN5091_c0_g1::TRINITY_DN5091_c0_g1_i1::g.94075::m.94075